MIITKINVENFRSYYGENSIEFSTNPKKPITIILGSNGGGKSSLMNAIQWCFYGKLVSVKEEDKRKPIRHTDCDDNDSYSVEIIFNHDGVNYSLDRGWNKSIKDYFNLQKLLDDGDLGPKIINPQARVNNIIPEELKNWFFYKAEDALSSINLQGSERFKEATRQIQGFTKIEQLIKDLEKVERRQQNNLDKLSDHSELPGIIIDIEKIESDLNSKQFDNTELSDDIKILKKAKESLEEQLKKIPTAEPLQNEKRLLQDHKVSLEKSLANYEKSLKLFIGENLPSIILQTFLNKRNKEIPQDKENEIDLERPLGSKLYNKIYKRGKCICGRPFEKGSPEDIELAKLQNDVLHPVFNTRVAKINTVMASITDSSQKFTSRYEEKKSFIDEINIQIGTKEGEINEIDKKLLELGKQDNKIKEINRDLLTNQSQTEAHMRKWGENDGKIRGLREELKSLEIKRDKIKDEGNKSAGLEVLTKKIEKLTSYAKEKLKKDEENSLKIILHELNQQLEKYTYSNMMVKIEPDTYRISTYETKVKNPKEKELSDGETELVKYCFITSILGLASQKTQSHLKYLSNPVSCPLIIDAPFTRMDNDFISGAVNAITENLEQIIFFGLPKDFKSYEDQIKDKVGKLYIAVKSDKSPRSSSKEKPSSHNIYGKDVDFVSYDNKNNSKPV